MSLFLQQVLNGLAVGSGYAMFGISFGLVFATMGILSIAHGQISVWGALSGLYVARHFGWSFLPAAVCAVVSAAILAVVVDMVAFQPLRGKANPISFVITSIGVWFILLSGIGKLLAFQDQTFDTSFLSFGTIQIGAIFLSAGQVWLVLSSLAVMFVVLRLMTKTRIGARIRAVGFSSDFASLSGISPIQTIVITCLISGAIAGLAGLMTGIAFTNVGTSLGEGLLIKGFAAVVVGGFGDVRGTYVGGLVIGIAEVLGGQYLGGELRDATAFAVLFLFLLFRPGGIFAEVKFGAAR
ncbi:MAG: branched-chain amino acid ABC transporter permease [Ilumatobacteraceae bacterium]